tara:strand:- start:15038 stop:16144 length:1107 start_codon:yes stop_codon:yes gene_type:complete
LTTITKSHELTNPQKETIIAFSFALAAAILVKIPTLFGLELDGNDGFYFRNMSLFVLPLLTGYFAYKRQLKTSTILWLSVAFVVAVVFANVYPFTHGNDTEVLLALHLPIALWLMVGIAYAGGEWGQVNGRMDFIRFSGELFIYYVLIALGGIVLTGTMAIIFQTISIDIEPLFEQWVLCGVVGAVIIAAWLVDIKKGVVENLAPMLARLFSPLFAIVLITFLGTLLFTGRGIEIERDVLIAFDMLLVVVICLLLYSISARDSQSPPGIFDYIQVMLVISALLADVIALWAISQRITDLGFTPNRVVALGFNLILLVNLAWSAFLYIRFLRGHASFSLLEKWQTDYLPVYAVWAAIVVIIIPPLFGFA